MLANLVEIQERVLKTLGDGGHATKSGALQLLTLEERLRILEETDIISGDRLDKVLCGGQLAKGDTEMVGVVKSVEEILVEWVNVLKAWETLKNEVDLLAESLLGELDLASIEVCCD